MPDATMPSARRAFHVALVGSSPSSGYQIGSTTERKAHRGALLDEPLDDVTLVGGRVAVGPVEPEQLAHVRTDELDLPDAPIRPKARFARVLDALVALVLDA
jgi:hypothetical protein